MVEPTASVPVHTLNYFKARFNVPNIVSIKDLYYHILPSQTNPIRKVIDTLARFCIPQVIRFIPLTIITCTPRNEATNTADPNYPVEYLKLFYKNPAKFCVFETFYSFSTNRIVGYIQIVQKGLSLSQKHLLERVLNDCFGNGFNREKNIIQYTEAYFHRPILTPPEYLRISKSSSDSDSDSDEESSESSESESSESSDESFSPEQKRKKQKKQKKSKSKQSSRRRGNQRGRGGRVRRGQRGRSGQRGRRR